MDMEEMFRGAGFSRVEESREGQSRLYGNEVPPYEPADSAELPHSLYVEGIK